ncbi:MAG: cupin domain-containing protein [Bdellovibrionota bacterium]
MSLVKLLGTHSVGDFLQASWPKNPFVVHGLGESIQELRDIALLESLETLLNSWPSLIQAHLPDVRDESSSVDANAKDARKLYASGMGLLFNNIQTLSPVLQNWLNGIRNDLGLPTSTHARCMVYATPDGKGTATHFDQNINFVLQLSGTKKWQLAPNMNVENPTQRHTLGQPLDPELASYLYEEMPPMMPTERRQEITLRPGSMLFVPRGWWHSTEAEGEALALNFTFNQPTWIDLFTLALRSRLSLSPEWRELADGVTSENKDRRLEAAMKLDQLLKELKEDLPNWLAEDVLGATEGDFE